MIGPVIHVTAITHYWSFLVTWTWIIDLVITDVNRVKPKIQFRIRPPTDQVKS